MNEQDKRVFKQYIEELNFNFEKNKNNIQLIANELGAN
jgi:ribosomal protein S17E